MSNGKSRTMGDALLAAALELGIGFTAETLAVSAWRNDPVRFGLAGYEREHLDMHRICGAIMGRKGLVSRGFLRKYDCGYALTDLGRARAGGKSVNGKKSKPSAAVSAEQENLLAHLLCSRAVALFIEGSQGEISFADVREFFKGSATTIREGLDALHRISEQSDILLYGKHVVSRREIEEIARTADYLTKRFGRK